MRPLAADECAHGHIVNGLRRSGEGIDIVLVREALPEGTPDEEVLEWAAREGRLLITQDRSTMVGHAWARVAAGLPMPGVLLPRKGASFREIIDGLVLIATCGEAEDFRDRVEYVPL